MPCDAVSTFHDPTLGLELPPLESRQITPPTPEEVWAPIGAAKELGGLSVTRWPIRERLPARDGTRLWASGSMISSGLATR